MEKGLVSCNKYFNKWKIKINPIKTQAIIFPFNKSPKRLARRPLLIGNNAINIQNDVKYLGVTLDKKLIFKRHINEICRKATKAFRALWPLLNKRSCLNMKNKNLLFKSVIRPILTYACPVWSTAANCHLNRLQVIQNKCLKMIYNKHWRYPTHLIHEETGYERIIDYIKRIKNKFYEKIESSSYPMIRECVEIIQS
ncbi:putative RNA-directed DNA polymerase from transposon X-element [Lucilia cuprina]|nr:putative RNA-directed DNA polymerase from transposon X-element [Lucilia cuprina]